MVVKQLEIAIKKKSRDLMSNQTYNFFPIPNIKKEIKNTF